MKILTILEGYSTPENLKHELAYLRQNLADAKADLRDNLAFGGEDDVVADIKADIAQITAEIEAKQAELAQFSDVSESADDLKAKLAKAKADYDDMPKNPGNQAGYDALDDQRALIKRLEQQLAQVSEAVKTTHPMRSGAAEQYVNVQGEIKARMNQLEGLLHNHAQLQRQDPRNWGYVGDVTEVMNKLVQLCDFLGKNGEYSA